MPEARIDFKMLGNILYEDVKKRQGLFYGNAKRSFDAKKRGHVLGNFSNHPVTLEMEAGPAAESSFLPKGNLYSFLGFHPNQDLTNPIRDVLNEQTQLLNQATTTRISNNRIQFLFQGTVPDLKDIRDVAPAPPDWGEKSWVEYIEQGIPNFIYYLYSKEGFSSKRKSRSGHGLQKKKTSPPTKGIPYVMDIIEKFVRLFK